MGESLRRYSFQTNRFFGTSSRAELFASRGWEGRRVAVATWRSVERLLDEIQHAASMTIPTSDVARYNAAPYGERVPVGRHTVNLLFAAKTVAQATGGAFDPTVAPLVDLWGFSAMQRNAEDSERSEQFAAPSTEDVKAALTLVGLDGVRLVEDGEGLTFLMKEPVPASSVCPSLMTRGLDFGGIAKGYAADAAFEVFRSTGLTSGYLNCGGSEIALLANPLSDDGAWRVPVLDPCDATNGARFEISARDTVVTTSAEYQHLRRMDGRDASHILNPKTGYPFSFECDQNASCIVCAVLEGTPASAADGLATAICTMPPREAFDLVSSDWFRCQFRVLLFVVEGSSAKRACSYFSTFDDSVLSAPPPLGPRSWTRIG